MNPIKTLLSDAAFASIMAQERVLFISNEKKESYDMMQTKEIYGLIDRKRVNMIKRSFRI